MRRALLALLLSCCAAPAAAQELKHEKYKLENGLTVILHEDHSLPRVAINTWFRVGSKDEPERRSGFAHIFEHLMFMGTRRVPGNGYDSLMEAGGGANNATTSNDRTNYFASGPAKILPLLLWLDADRLEDLGVSMTKEKLDLQRDVVRNERRQSYENRPYGKAELLIPRLVYPVGHPYHIPGIGTHEDLEAATLQDVKDFYATFYVPNNASLVIAGDFDPKATKELVAKLFGTLPRGAAPEHRTHGPVKLERQVRATTTDDVPQALISVVWHAPGSYQEGEAELDLAAGILAEGNASRLYKRLVMDDGLATQVRAYVEDAQLGSLFRIEVTAKEGADLDKVEKALDEELARFLADGPSAAEFARHQARLELDLVSSLQSIEARADKLNEYDHYWGNPDSFQRDLDRYRKATPQGIRDRARRHLGKDARLVLRVLPDRAAKSSERDERPGDAAEKAFAPPAPRTFKLANGVPVQLWERPELPLVATTLVFRGEGPLAGRDGKRAGLSCLATAMLEEGAGDLDALAFGEALREIGADMTAAPGVEGASVSLLALERNLEKAWSLLADAARRPRFEAKDWERVKELHLADLEQTDEEPASVAERVARFRLFGDESPCAWPVDGTIESVRALTVEDARTEHKALFNPARLTILVAGAVTEARARAALEKHFGSWEASSRAEAGGRLEPSERKKLEVVFVDKPGAVQTVIRLEAPGVKVADARRVELRLLNTVLGGCFTSRLNANLREAKGWAYGAGSRFRMEPSFGTFAASTQVRADATGGAVREVLLELEKLRQGDLTDAEVVKARETLRSDAVENFQGLRGILGVASELVRAGLPFETIARDLDRASKVTCEELNKLAREALPVERGVLVLVGDKKTILEQVKDLGDLLEVDARGRPAKK